MKNPVRSQAGYLLIHTLILVLVFTLLTLSLAGVWRWRLNIQRLLERQLEVESLMVSGIAMAHQMNRISGHKNDIWLELPPQDGRTLIIKFELDNNGFQVLLKSGENIIESYTYQK